MYTHVTELTFKRARCTPAMRGVVLAAPFFIIKEKHLMDLYIYSDESGVFDYVHNDFFVFGWIIFFSKSEKENANRKYLTAERHMQNRYNSELKACIVNNKDKLKLFRSLNEYEKGSVIIKQNVVKKTCFANKKTKQRYLDYAFKIGLKRHLESLIKEGVISIDEIENIYLFQDEHSTATDGLYELRESLLNEFKYGTHNWNYRKFFPPLFPKIKNVDVQFCESKKNRLIRCADIIANRVYYCAVNNKIVEISNKVFVHRLP